jgi:hypothetical protein
MKFFRIVAGVAILIVVLVIFFARMLPISHRVTGQATYRASPRQLFELITDVKSFPQWRPSVKEVEVLPPVDGHAQFREIGKDGSILYQVDSAVPNEYLMTTIADRSLPFGGKWTYQLTPHGDSTTLTITEDGEVYNPIFRFVSRFVFGHTATMDRYLNDVRRRVADYPTPARS